MYKLPAIAFALTTLWFASPASAAYTAEQQAACQNDAFRLCPNDLQDENRARACMSRNFRNLSPNCRRVMQGGSSQGGDNRGRGR